MNEIRLKRVESLIRDKVSRLIMQGDVKDPRVDSSVTLTRIKAAKDLSSARIWVSSFGGENATRRAVKGLSNAASFIQSRLGRELRFRHTPKLYFNEDDSVRRSIDVIRTIDRVMEEDKIQN